MSIKGTTKELFIGKTGVNIFTFLDNRITLEYGDIKRIDYCYAAGLKAGFMNFITLQNAKEEFAFSTKVNEPVQRAIDYIREHAPHIRLVEHSADEEQKKRSISIQATFGYKELGFSLPLISITQRPNGEVYLGKNDAILYSIVSYKWNGPEYNTLTTSKTQENALSKTKKSGKALKIGTGALLLGSTAGVAGALVGAAMGAGSKGKSKTKTDKTSSTTQLSKNIENDTLANLTLRALDTGKLYTLSFSCNSTIDAKIRCFDFEAAKQDVVGDISSSLEGIKALKELLDMGAITQEEFETKKRQLLG